MSEKKASAHYKHERKVSDYYNHDYKRDHSENLEKICILCYGKSKGKVMNENHKRIFRERVYKDYDLHCHLLPCGLCKGCATALLSQGKNICLCIYQYHFVIKVTS